MSPRALTPLARDTVTPASRRTIPTYMVGSFAMGVAILGTLVRDHGIDDHWPAALLFVENDLHVPVWLVGFVFILTAASMGVAMLQGDRWAYLVSLGWFRIYLLGLAAAFTWSSLIGGATYLAPVPFVILERLAAVSWRSIAVEEKLPS